MLRRPLLTLLLLMAVASGFAGAVYAQLESAERGIMPIDSSGTLEITGIHVDVAGKDANDARFNGWRIAQRRGFQALWAKVHRRPAVEAPVPADSTLDQMVSSIIVEREQIGPNRYIADLGVLFDRSRAGPLLGVGGEQQRSVPMLLIPVIVTGGSATTVELRNVWQRAWAQFRTSASPIDYVRVSGLGVDPLLVNAAQTVRPGRGWWRNIIDLYGAADILTAEVMLHRAYPGGPAVGRFIGRHGPDAEIIGGFTLTAANSEALPQMMAEGVRRMDELFALALAAGRLQRDPTLDIPPPPLSLEDLLQDEAETPTDQKTERPTQAPANAYQVQIVARDVNTYNFAMAHLRTLGGIEQITPQAINPNGTSYILVSFRGNIAALAGALSGRGWNVDYGGTVVRMSGGAGPPPPPPSPPPPVQQPAQPPAQPVQPRPQPPQQPQQQQPPGTVR